MPKSLILHLARFLKIRPGEEFICFLLFLYFFLITSPHTIIKSLRYAKILKQTGVNGLPPAYLLAAIVTGLIVGLHAKIQVQVTKQVLIITSLLFFIITGLLFWVILPTGGNWLSIAYWVWATVLIVVLLTHFWITINEVFNPREAKRLIGFFGSGGILGGILGGLLTKLLARSALSQYLLPISCIFLFACIFVVRAVYSRLKKPRQVNVGSNPLPENVHMPKVGLIDTFNSVRKNRFLVQIALLVTITIFVGTMIDFQFSSMVGVHFQSEEDLQGFLGLFFAGLTVFAFFLQLLMTSNLIKNFGVRMTLLFAPLTLLLFAFGITLLPGLFFAVMLKGNEESLSYSLNQSIREILYIPIAPDLRFKAKIFIDMFLNRFSKGICALFLMLITYFNCSSRLFSLFIIIFILIWLLINLRISREYVSAVKQNIQLKWARADKDVEEKLDVDYTKLVFDAIESRDRSAELYAMHVFDLLRQNKLSPEVKNIIAQKAQEVKAISVGDMFEAQGTAWVSEKEENIDEAALQSDIMEIMAMDSYQQVMQNHADQVLEKSKEASVEKMELAKAIGLMDPHAPMVERLESLILDLDAEVSRYAIESAGKLQLELHIPVLIHKLKDPLTREDAAGALKKFGNQAVSPLAVFMLDPKKNIELRQTVTNVLSRVATQEAADSLVKQLEKKSDVLDHAVISALDRIRSENPEIVFSYRAIKRKSLLLIKKYYTAYLQSEEQLSLDNRKNEKIISGLLNDIFKLLGLVYPQDDIVKAYQNLKTGTSHSVSYAIELLDNTLKKDLRDFILPIIEEMSHDERNRYFRHLLKLIS